MLLTTLCYAQLEAFKSSDLPIFIINTKQNQTIPDEPKIEAQLGIIYNGEDKQNSVSDEHNEYNGKIAIELRGNGSIHNNKVSYAFETQDEDGENNNVSILGLPSENDWILYAPETDKSLMRNVLAYQLANEMNHYAPRTKFCELVVNGDYLGIFVFMEKIKRDKNRVNIKKFDEFQSPEEGGFIIRIDSWWNKSLGWEAISYDYKGRERNILYQYVYPKADEITTAQARYIQTFMNGFETAMYNAPLYNLQAAYSPYIDIENFADYFLINELSKNPDGYRLSTFMHKDANSKDPRLKLGPIWDYNFGFGNYCCGYHTTYDGWEFDESHWDFPSQIPFWADKLMHDPSFAKVINERWDMWRSGLISCAAFEVKIDHWAAKVNEAKERNFSKWPILGTNVTWDWNAGANYEDEINLLKDWICKRIDWIDLNLPKLVKSKEEYRISVSPNPCDSYFNLTYFANNLEEKGLGIYNAAGTLLLTKKYAFAEGENYILFDNLNLSAGIYFLKIDGEIPVKFISN